MDEVNKVNKVNMDEVNKDIGDAEKNGQSFEFKGIDLTKIKTKKGVEHSNFETNECGNVKNIMTEHAESNIGGTESELYEAVDIKTEIIEIKHENDFLSQESTSSQSFYEFCSDNSKPDCANLSEINEEIDPLEAGNTSSAWINEIATHIGREEIHISSQDQQQKYVFKENSEGKWDCPACLRSKFNFRLAAHFAMHMKQKGLDIIPKSIEQFYTVQLNDGERFFNFKKVAGGCWSCLECQKAYFHKTEMDQHVMVHIRHNYLCSLCQKTYPNLITFRTHALGHNKALERPEMEIGKYKYKGDGDGIWYCPVCDKKLINKILIKCHIKIPSVEEPFYCCLCNTGFAEKSHLAAHVLKHNLGAEEKSIYPKFNSNSDGSKFYCPECNKQFSFKNSLKSHYRLVHYNKRRYPCPICKLRWMHRPQLEEHLKTHSSDKSVNCEICNIKFKSTKQLNIHMKTHHPPTQLMPEFVAVNNQEESVCMS